MTDQQVTEALKRLTRHRDDESAWQTVFAGSWATALGAAHRALRGQMDLAKDVAQEAFKRVVLYCDFRDLQDVNSFRAYLRAVSLNAARDVLRRLAPEVAGNEEMDAFPARRGSPGTPEELLRSEELSDELLASLDTQDRKLLTLLVEGYTLREMASSLGLTYSNAGVRLHRLRRYLRNYLKEKNL